MLASFGAKVDDPVGASYDVEVMLYHDYRVAGINEFGHNLEETLDVVHVKTCGRLIHDVDVTSLAQFGRNLQPLVLSARQRTECLTQLQVIEADFLKEQQIARDLLLIGKEVECFLDSHVEYFGHVLATVQVAKSLLVVSFAFTFRATGLDGIQKVHLKTQESTAFALGTGTCRIEAEE